MPDYVEGHRQRMRLRAEQIDTEDMRDQDLMELLLFYALPRRDTKPYAAALIERFGSVAGVLGAPQSELTKIKGIGGRTAEWLARLSDALDAYIDLNSTDKPRLNTYLRTKRFFGKFFKTQLGAAAWQFNLNSGGYLLEAVEICDGCLWGEPENLRKAFTSALLSGANTVIIGCCEPGVNEFEQYDIDCTVRYAATLSVAGIQLLDHVRFSGEGCFSMHESGLLNKIRELVKSNKLCEDYLSEDA